MLWPKLHNWPSQPEPLPSLPGPCGAPSPANHCPDLPQLTRLRVTGPLRPPPSQRRMVATACGWLSPSAEPAGFTATGLSGHYPLASPQSRCLSLGRNRSAGAPEPAQGPQEALHPPGAATSPGRLRPHQCFSSGGTGEAAMTLSLSAQPSPRLRLPHSLQ